MTGTSKLQGGRRAVASPNPGPRIADFQGRWRLQRRIDDRRAGLGRFVGEALFTSVGVGLLYAEEGVLTLENGASFAATRRYRWEAEKDQIAVYFEDGRFFHRFSPSGRVEAAHFCDPDQYDVTYDFTSWPAWSSSWTVRGPRKDYVMTSSFQRLNP